MDGVKNVPKNERSREQHDVANTSVPTLNTLLPTPQVACREAMRILSVEVESAMERNQQSLERQEIEGSGPGRRPVKELKRSAVKTRGPQFIVSDVRYENYKEFQTPQGPRCTIPVQGRLTFRFGDMSDEAQREANKVRQSVNAPVLGPDDRIALDMRFAIGNPREMQTTYGRTPDGSNARQLVNADFQMDGVSSDEAFMFASTKLADGSLQRAEGYRLVKSVVGEEMARGDFVNALAHPNVPTLARVLDDKRKTGGEFTPEQHEMAHREASGRLVADKGNLGFGSRLSCSNLGLVATLGSAVGAPSYRDPETEREPKGQVPVDGQGGLTTRRDSLAPDIGVLNGAAISEVYTRQCTDQRFMRDRVREVEAAEQQRQAGRGVGM
jgi:hypothetical protein